MKSEVINDKPESIELKEYLECFKALPNEDYSILEKALNENIQLLPHTTDGPGLGTIKQEKKLLELVVGLPKMYSEFEKAETLKTKIGKHEQTIKETENTTPKSYLLTQQPTLKQDILGVLAAGGIVNAIAIPLVIAGILPNWFISADYWFTIFPWQVGASIKHCRQTRRQRRETARRNQDLFRQGSELEHQMFIILNQYTNKEITQEQVRERFTELEAQREELRQRQQSNEPEPVYQYGPASVLGMCVKYPKSKIQNHNSKRKARKLSKNLAKQKHKMAKEIAKTYGGGDLKYEPKWYKKQKNQILGFLDAEEKKDFNVRYKELEQLLYPTELLDLRISIEEKLEREYAALDKNDMAKTGTLVKKLKAAEKAEIEVGTIGKRLKEELNKEIAQRKKIKGALEN